MVDMTLAKSINYPLGFFKIGNRIRLTNELLFLYAFMGGAALRICFKEYQDFHEYDVDSIVQIYQNNLINQWIIKSVQPEFDIRLNSWADLLKNSPDYHEQYAEDLEKLTETFYKFLTQSPCNPHNKLMLTARFNGYMGRFIQSIYSFIEVSQFR